MTRTAKRGLGRGLDALIRSGQTATHTSEVGLDQIVDNPYQPRVTTDSESLSQLADSIRRHGILQPLLVSQTGLDGQGRARYQLVAGERRWRAARLAGLERVPVMVKEVTPIELLSLALVENLQRDDLNPLEQAEAYRQLIETFGMTQAEVAEQVGKSRSAVANVLRLANLPAAVKEALFSGKIDEGHARALLGLADEGAQLEALDRVLAERMSVRATETLVRHWAENDRDASQTVQSPEDKATEDMLRAALGTRVRLLRVGKGGRLVLHFYSDEQLSGMFDLLTAGQEPVGEEYFQAG